MTHTPDKTDDSMPNMTGKYSFHWDGRPVGFIRCKICEWERYFPEGVSLTTYRYVGKLIREHGTQVMIEMNSPTEDHLRAALRRVERTQ